MYKNIWDNIWLKPKIKNMAWLGTQLVSKHLHMKCYTESNMTITMVDKSVKNA